MLFNYLSYKSGELHFYTEGVRPFFVIFFSIQKGVLPKAFAKLYFAILIFTGSLCAFSVTFFFRSKKESNQRKRDLLRGGRWDIHVQRISHCELIHRVIALLCQAPSEPEGAASCCA